METEVKYTLAEQLALRFLLPVDQADRDDALSGLVGVCFRAKRNLFIPSDVPGVYDRVFWSTHYWIENWLQAFFKKYQGRSEQEIREAAEQRAFRYIGRLCYLRLADEIRKGYRRTCRASRIVRVTQLHEAHIVLSYVRRHQGQIEREQGGQFYRGLDAMVRCYPVKRKGQTTQAIAERCRVTLRQARNLKSRIMKICYTSPSGWAIGFRNLENSWSISDNLLK